MEEPKVHTISLAKVYQPVSSEVTEDRGGWQKYGVDNAYPKYLGTLKETSPVHGALCTSIAQMVAGKGIASIIGQTNARIANLKIEKLIPLCANDLKDYGGFYLEVIRTMDGSKIASINHLPFNDIRLGIEDDKGNVNNVYYSRDWGQTRKAKYKPIPIDMFDGTRTQTRSVYKSFDGSTYPKPDYFSSLNWCELDREISMFHINNIQNGLMPSFIIDFFNGQAEPEQANTIKRDWENKLSGSQNAGKFIMNFNEAGTQAPQITQFPLSDADKQYQFLSTEATQKIMIAHRATSPLLFGIRDGSGLGSNKDEMLQALEIFTNQVIEPMQRIISSSFDEILKSENTIGATEIVPNTPIAVQLSGEKKKPAEMTVEEENEWIEYLSTKGEKIDEEEYVLIDETEIHNPEAEAMNADRVVKLYEAYADPDLKSKMDSGLIKVRYGYSTSLRSNTRRFCKAMVEFAKQGLVYRYEDITEMSESGVNGGLAPKGKSTYNIFLYKGGAYCHHFWSRKVYMRKREAGKFLPNKGLANDERITTKKANDLGFEFKDTGEYKEASTRPIDTPTRGKLN